MVAHVEQYFVGITVIAVAFLIDIIYYYILLSIIIYYYILLYYNI